MTKKKIHVMKFGGTSVGSPDKIKSIANRLIKLKSKDPEHAFVVIVSAMGKKTDELVALSRSCTSNPDAREYDALISTGENISAALLSICLIDKGYPAISLSGPQAGILTESQHSRAKVLNVTPKRIYEAIEKNKIVVITGFQGINENEDITTIGRGGSDTSAVILASVLNCKVCEIFTDVNGIYTTDPRVVKTAKKIKEISYEEMLDLASLGAKVLHPRAVETAKINNIELHVRSSFSDEEGTLVKEFRKMELNKSVTGIAVNKNEAMVSIVGVENSPGVAGKIFDSLAKENINIDIIIQSVKYGDLNSITFSVDQNDLLPAKNVAHTLLDSLKAKEVKVEENIAKVSIVGVGMISKPGVAATMFSALGKEGINIKHISTSEIKISCIIAKTDAEKAQNLLHNTFGLDN